MANVKMVNLFRLYYMQTEALPTLMRFQKYALSFLSKMHRSIRVHTAVLMRFHHVHKP